MDYRISRDELEIYYKECYLADLKSKKRPTIIFKFVNYFADISLLIEKLAKHGLTKHELFSIAEFNISNAKHFTTVNDPNGIARNWIKDKINNKILDK